MKDVPKHGGHVKPGSAVKHTPAGYEHSKTCPTCHGSGKIPAVNTAVTIAGRRA